MAYYKKVFTNFINNATLKLQLSILLITTMSIILISLIFYNYSSNKKLIFVAHKESITAFLNLEIQSMDDFLSEIDRYSLIIRQDPTFMKIIQNTNTITYEDKLYLQNLVKNNFYSRSDLHSFKIHLVNQPLVYYIDNVTNKVVSLPFVDVEELEGYHKFTKGPYYNHMVPSLDKSFITYYRTIIHIPTKQPLAIIELSFDNTFPNFLKDNRQNDNKNFIILDDNNQILYNNLDKSIDELQLKKYLESSDQKNKNSYTIANKEYLIFQNHSKKYGYKIINFTPADLLYEKVDKIKNISILIGIISITITTVVAIFFIRLVTKPLSTLAHRLRRVGAGNFKTTINVGGSYEIIDLVNNFNDMIYKIDDLINKTYISELNEQTSRLIALEAQLNPHFLYNTLQSISAEAIVNNQPKIDFMITTLASILRYSIKEDDLVTIKTELWHVENYLKLQQCRFDENLTYKIEVAENTKDKIIPKISIQTLVENSIIHGISGNTTKVFITIKSYIVNDLLYLTVNDNGNGITEEKINKLNIQFKQEKKDYNNDSIGLINLYSRLEILFNKKAELKIESNKKTGTTVTLIMPIKGGHTCIKH